MNLLQRVGGGRALESVLPQDRQSQQGSRDSYHLEVAFKPLLPCIPSWEVTKYLRFFSVVPFSGYINKSFQVCLGILWVVHPFPFPKVNGWVGSNNSSEKDRVSRSPLLLKVSTRSKIGLRFRRKLVVLLERLPVLCRKPFG